MLAAETRVLDDVEMKFTAVVVMLAAGSWLVSCGPVPPPVVEGPGEAEIFFPTVPVADAYPAALIDGRLDEHNRCIFVASGGDRWLLLWPKGYEADFLDGRLEVSDQNGKLVGRDGDEVSLGGGEGNPTDMGGAANAEAWATEL